MRFGRSSGEKSRILQRRTGLIQQQGLDVEVKIHPGLFKEEKGRYTNGVWMKKLGYTKNF